MSRHLGELSLSSCFEMIPFPPPPIKKLSLLKADKHCLVIGPQWITFQKMKCQPLALILILFSIGHKAVKGMAARSQVADRLAGEGACSARSSLHSGCLFGYLCPQVFNSDKKEKEEERGRAGGQQRHKVGPSTGRNGGKSGLVVMNSEMSHSSLLVGPGEAMEGERQQEE